MKTNRKTNTNNKSEQQYLKGDNQTENTNHGSAVPIQRHHSKGKLAKY